MKEEIIQTNIQQEIIKKIESGEIHMKSKSYFLFKLCLLAFLVISVFAVSTFLLSYILFSLSSGGHFFLLSFGFEGIYHFFIALPWLLLVVNVLLVLLLDKLLKSFKFGYKSPALYLFIGTFVFVTLLSTLVNMTSFHRNMLKRAEQRKLPLVNDFYYSPIGPRSLPGSYRGLVVSVDSESFSMAFGSTSIKVIALHNVDLEKYINEGDLVFVAGEIIDNEIKAYGIKKLNR